MIYESEIRDEIREQPCAKCGEPLDLGVDFKLTFFRGKFIVLHSECGDFINTQQKGARHRVDTQHQMNSKN
jgi:RNase P subunit RPR2